MCRLCVLTLPRELGYTVCLQEKCSKQRTVPSESETSASSSILNFIYSGPLIRPAVKSQNVNTIYNNEQLSDSPISLNYTRWNVQLYPLVQMIRLSFKDDHSTKAALKSNCSRLGSFSCMHISCDVGPIIITCSTDSRLRNT